MSDFSNAEFCYKFEELQDIERATDPQLFYVVLCALLARICANSTNPASCLYDANCRIEHGIAVQTDLNNGNLLIKPQLKLVESDP